MNDQAERFGLPRLVDRPADGDGTVTARLEIRGGVLTDATVDLGQFGGADAGTLPLDLSLAGGSALSLKAPESDGPLDPRELTVALMYLSAEAAERNEDPDRADVPGPVQP
ncbi:hypothetical protein [Streptomyces sp. RFCAC02]|uniref:hypothetical protein n=1 Tax=Streptomyces sp. RFCAC02 TaxID=2499143 RepID=UPI001020B640|nr:hypothetical protein [Streptomyces sp. RFCAC02]